MSETKTGTPVASFNGSPFRLHQPFLPAGDQPEAIRLLVEGLEDGLSFQTLLGVTGSGKTMPVANVIAPVLLVGLFGFLFHRSRSRRR